MRHATAVKPAMVYCAFRGSLMHCPIVSTMMHQLKRRRTVGFMFSLAGFHVFPLFRVSCFPSWGFMFSLFWGFMFSLAGFHVFPPVLRIQRFHGSHLTLNQMAKSPVTMQQYCLTASPKAAHTGYLLGRATSYRGNPPKPHPLRQLGWLWGTVPCTDMRPRV